MKMKAFASLAIVGILLIPSWASAQQNDDFGLRLGLGILKGITDAANNNNSNGPYIRPRPAPSYDPNSSSSSNFNGFNNLFQNQNNGFNRPNNNGYNRPYNNGNYRPNYNGYSNNYNYNYNNGYSSGNSYSEPPIAPKVYSRAPIIISCPDWCEGTCQYSLVSSSGKEYVYTMRPGTKQEFKETTDWTVKYQPSGSGSYKTYRLRGGKSYELRCKSNGSWAFYSSQS